MLFQLQLHLLLEAGGQLGVVRLERPALVAQHLLVQLGRHARLALLRALLDEAGVLLAQGGQLGLLLPQGLHGLVLPQLGQLQPLQQLEHLLGHLPQLVGGVPRLGLHAQPLALRRLHLGLQVRAGLARVAQLGRQPAVGLLLAPPRAPLHLQLRLQLHAPRVARAQLLLHARHLVLGLPLGLLPPLQLLQQLVLLLLAHAQLLLQRLQLHLRLQAQLGAALLQLLRLRAQQPHLLGAQLPLARGAGGRLLVRLGRGEQRAVLAPRALQVAPQRVALARQPRALRLLRLQQPQQLAVVVGHDLELLVLLGGVRLGGLQPGVGAAHPRLQLEVRLAHRAVLLLGGELLHVRGVGLRLQGVQLLQQPRVLRVQDAQLLLLHAQRLLRTIFSGCAQLCFGPDLLLCSIRFGLAHSWRICETLSLVVIIHLWRLV
mmetsp:Transcript_38968/g.57284  ORF Transcript_38968/g.57284 Transcript_38968/m.57284 type:complete len:431 (-) Transcript_38968:199-1491(-)